METSCQRGFSLNYLNRNWQKKNSKLLKLLRMVVGWQMTGDRWHIRRDTSHINTNFINFFRQIFGITADIRTYWGIQNFLHTGFFYSDLATNKPKKNLELFSEKYNKNKKKHNPTICSYPLTLYELFVVILWRRKKPSLWFLQSFVTKELFAHEAIKSCPNLQRHWWDWED